MTSEAVDNGQSTDTAPYAWTYEKLFGDVPDGVRRRWAVTSEHGRFPSAALLEQLRAEVLFNSPLGLKVQQLVHFGQLVVLGNRHAATSHAGAALRAGATPQDLLSVAETALITAGVPGYGLAISVIDEVVAAHHS
ncbi:MAG: hypothetical protein JWM93_1594 [Frankiales bacterium]|nr:hypothetical protein [Frankiales bacterium]